MNIKPKTPSEVCARKTALKIMPAGIKNLSVSRAFGDFDAHPFVTCIPDMYILEINREHDKFFIMACDGLWDVVSSQESVNFVNKLINTKKNIAMELAKYALSKGSTDNISVIVVFLN